MNEPENQLAGESDQILELVHQGLLPLPLRAILVARLVCKQWQQGVGCLIPNLQIPYSTWSGNPTNSTPSSVVAAAAAIKRRRLAGVAGVADKDSSSEEDEEDADYELPQGMAARAKRRNFANSKGEFMEVSTRRGGLTAAAAAGGSSSSIVAEQQQQQQQSPEGSEDQLMTDGQQQQQQQDQWMADGQQQQQHEQEVARQEMQQDYAEPQQQLAEQQGPTPLPAAAATKVATDEAAAYVVSPAAAPSAAADSAGSSPNLGPGRTAAATVDQQQLLPQRRQPLQHLATSFPWCSSITLLCRGSSNSSKPNQPALAASLQAIGFMPQLKTLVFQGTIPQAMWRPLLTGMQQQQGLHERLVCLQLLGVDLPREAELLDTGLVGLRGLRELVLHANMKSPVLLQSAHLEALAHVTQLECLSLLVYQAAAPRLNPLLALTNLKNLDVSYKGIFNDQRPILEHPASISCLVNLTSLSSAGMANPLLPQPNLTNLRCLSATGNSKRLAGQAVQLISSCKSLKQLKLETGRRGISAIAADHLHYIGAVRGLTSITMALSKGGLTAGKSTQQLTQLSSLAGLRGLVLTSADHRLGFSNELLAELAGQWSGLESLRLANFSPLQGLSGFGAFTSLTALSLKPGTGVAKLLVDLKEGLAPLARLQRLHLDFRGALQLEHVEAVAEACSSRLQHLSLNMRSSSIGSKAIVLIGQLACLTSLQLLGTTTATLSGPPAAVALQGMTQLKWLSVQAAEESAMEQQPLKLGQYLGDGIEGLTGLQELRIWLGFGVEGRQAEGQLVRRVEAQCHSCRCRVMPEPEKPVL